MRRIGVWAMCAAFVLGGTGCGSIPRIHWIPWIGEKKSCDLNTYRVPAVAGAFGAGAAEARADGPVLDVSETDFDFGKVSEDKLLFHDFKVRNVGKSVLRIKKVIPS